MKIVYVFADSPEEWNCSEWRCAVPARAINRVGMHTATLLSLVEFARLSPEAEQVCAPADVIVVQRNLIGPVLAAIQHWKARDKVIIADFDDAYDLMPASNPSYAYWVEGRRAVGTNGGWERIDPPPLMQFKWGLRLVHAATTPSKRLAGDWEGYAKMLYLPNYIDLDLYQNFTSEPHEGVVIGWGGSVSHLQSFTGSRVMQALQRVCRVRPQVKVMICGNDQRIFEQLPLPAAQKVLQPWVPHAAWPRVLSQFDIGLAPLDGAYDERRSWIKVLEYMVMKIPWVASEGPPYQEFREYGWLVKNTVSAWERVLLDMVDHLEDYKVEAAREPYLFGVAQGADENVERIVGVYEKVVKREGEREN
ncbi:MAG: glycosyltransferase [Anaerolineales bacterium]|nr:glycosyltransferase [Anaerolineales bacterium]